MYIRKFLLVSCIASGIVVSLLYGKNVGSNDVKSAYRDRGFSKFMMVVNGIRGNVKEEDDYLFELYIPKIDLLRRVYDFGNKLNNVDINVELLEASIKESNLYFLASHSGGGQASYFDDLIYLEIGDVIFLKYRDKNLSYVVDKIFYIEKNGYFEVEDRDNRLFLITCSLTNSKEQLVIRGQMMNSY